MKKTIVALELDGFDVRVLTLNLCDLDLGSLECIGWNAVNAEDESGVFEDY